MANKHLLLLLLGVINVIIRVDSKCPDDKICDCTEDYIKCNCTRREAITFNGTNEGEEGFLGEEILISRCGRVKIVKLALSRLILESLHISDVLELHIESFSLYDAEIENFSISKIKNFTLENQGFGDIKRITNLTMSEVTIGSLEPSVFSKTVVRHLIIKKSTIGTMKSRSLEPSQCESVTIENTGIHNISTSAINIARIANFRFLHNVVNVTEINSFALAQGKVEFGYCRFLQISSKMIFAKRVESFSFHNNTVISCEEKAFWEVQTTKEARFVNNNILTAKIDSLIPNNGPNSQDLLTITSENNLIGCNCSIEWLIKLKSPKYNYFKERNNCSFPKSVEGLKLSQLKLQRDKDGNCSILTDSSAEDDTSSDILTTIGKTPSDGMPAITESQEPPTTPQSTVTRRDRVTKAIPISKQRQRAPCERKNKQHGSSADTMASCNTVLILLPLAILIS